MTCIIFTWNKSSHIDAPRWSSPPVGLAPIPPSRHASLELLRMASVRFAFARTSSFFHSLYSGYRTSSGWKRLNSPHSQWLRPAKTVATGGEVSMRWNSCVACHERRSAIPCPSPDGYHVGNTVHLEGHVLHRTLSVTSRGSLVIIRVDRSV